MNIGGLINKNKSGNDCSSLISLQADNKNVLHRPPLTFKAQINFVILFSLGGGALKSGTQERAAFDRLWPCLALSGSV